MADNPAPRVTFRAVLERGGKTATGFEVPADKVQELGSGQRPPVVVRLGTHTYRSTVAVMGGRSMVPVSAEQRSAAGVSAGDELDVELTLDTAPRTAEVPADLAAALDAEPSARALFESLSNSQKKWHVLSVEGAKTAETRQRRIEKSVSSLAAGRKQG